MGLSGLRGYVVFTKIGNCPLGCQLFSKKSGYWRRDEGEARYVSTGYDSLRVWYLCAATELRRLLTRLVPRALL